MIEKQLRDESAMGENWSPERLGVVLDWDQLFNPQKRLIFVNLIFYL